MDNISINDNWSVAILIAVVIIYIIFKMYDSVAESPNSRISTVVTESKNLL